MTEAFDYDKLPTGPASTPAPQPDVDAAWAKFERSGTFASHVRSVVELAFRAGHAANRSGTDVGARERANVYEYVQDYEWRGDGGDYIPNEREKQLIEDAIEGYLSDCSVFAPTRTNDTIARLVGLLERAAIFVNRHAHPQVWPEGPAVSLKKEINAALAELRAGEDRR